MGLHHFVHNPILFRKLRRVFPWPGDTSWNLSTIFNRPTFELNIWTLNTPFASQLVSWGNLQNITQLCVSLNSTFLSNFSTDVNTGFQWLTEGATKLGPSKVADLLRLIYVAGGHIISSDAEPKHLRHSCQHCLLEVAILGRRLFQCV